MVWFCGFVLPFPSLTQPYHPSMSSGHRVALDAATVIKRLQDKPWQDLRTMVVRSEVHDHLVKWRRLGKVGFKWNLLLLVCHDRSWLLEEQSQSRFGGLFFCKGTLKRGLLRTLAKGGGGPRRMNRGHPNARGSTISDREAHAGFPC